MTQSQVNSYKKKIHSLLTLLTKSENELSSLQNRLNRTAREKESLQTRLDELQEDFCESIKEKKKQISDLENELSKKDKIIKELNLRSGDASVGNDQNQAGTSGIKSSDTKKN